MSANNLPPNDAFIQEVIDNPMRHIKTVEESKALPEGDLYKEKREVQANGTTLITPIITKARVMAVEEDDILFFVDDDGITKTVHYTEEGPVKVVWRL